LHNYLVRYRKLWTSLSCPTSRIMIWRVLLRAFKILLESQLEKCRRECPLCRSRAETTEHLFFNCVGPRRRRERLWALLEDTELNINDFTFLFEVLGLAVNRFKRSPTMHIPL
jgi:hypothetical protein